MKPIHLLYFRFIEEGVGRKEICFPVSPFISISSLDVNCPLGSAACKARTKRTVNYQLSIVNWRSLSCRPRDRLDPHPRSPRCLRSHRQKRTRSLVSHPSLWRHNYFFQHLDWGLQVLNQINRLLPPQRMALHISFSFLTPI